MSKFAQNNHSISQQNNVINLSSYGSNSGNNNQTGSHTSTFSQFNNSQGIGTKKFTSSGTSNTNTNLNNLNNNVSNLHQGVPAVKSSSNLYSAPKTTKASIKDTFKDKRQYEFSAFNKSDVPNFNMLSINTPTNNNIKSYTKSIQGSSTINKISVSKEGSISGVNSGRDGNNNAFVYMSANTNNAVFSSSTTNKEKSQITNFGGAKNVPSSTTSKGGIKIDYLSTQKKQASIKRFGK